MKNKGILLIVLSLSFIFVACGSKLFSEPLNGAHIMKEMEKQMRGDSSQGRLKMEIPSKRELVIDFWISGTDKALLKIISPPKEAGQVTLKSDKMLYIYEPKLEKTAKIPSNFAGRPWMGSTFTYDDMIKATTIISDYKHRLTGTEMLGSLQTWKIESIPNTGIPVLWGKIVFLVGKDFLPRRQEFYNERGRLIKVLEFSEFKTMGDRTFPSVWKMTDKNQGTSSVIRYQRIAFNTLINPYIFSIKSLQ